jgi:hypothetical protein
MRWIKISPDTFQSTTQSIMQRSTNDKINKQARHVPTEHNPSWASRVGCLADLRTISSGMSWNGWTISKDQHSWITNAKIQAQLAQREAARDKQKSIAITIRNWISLQNLSHSCKFSQRKVNFCGFSHQITSLKLLSIITLACRVSFNCHWATYSFSQLASELGMQVQRCQMTFSSTPLRITYRLFIIINRCCPKSRVSRKTFCPKGKS